MAMHVEKYGSQSKQALTLIHGWGMHSGVWQPILDRLTAHYCVHCVDLPGMGLSETISPYTLANISAEVSMLLAEKTHILGWSLGGQVAMQLALDTPDKIGKLVLVGATPKFTAAVDWPCGVLLQNLEKFGLDVERDYRTTTLKFLSLQCMGAVNMKDTVRILREAFALKPAPNMVSLKQALRLLETNDLRAQLQYIQTQTLILHGEKDGLSPIGAGEYLAENIQSSQLVRFPNASHAPFLSHPNEFMQSLNQFLQ